MANEVTYASLADLRLSEAASAEYFRLLADRTVLPSHPAFAYIGDARGSGSSTLKVSHLGIDGYDILAATSDGSAVANTAHTDGSTTVTVQRYSKAYAPTDLARATGALGLITPERFAMDAVASASGTLVDIIANLIDGFTATIGTTTVDMTAQNFLDAKATLEIANVPGPYICVLHSRQFADLLADLNLNVSGAAAFQAAPEALAQLNGAGFKGTLWGVQIYTTNRVVTANSGADRAGAMWGRGGIVWADMSLDVDDPNNQVLVGGKVLFEQDRDAASGLSKWVTHAYLGASVGIDGCGVSIITDA